MSELKEEDIELYLDSMDLDLSEEEKSSIIEFVGAAIYLLNFIEKIPFH